MTDKDKAQAQLLNLPLKAGDQFTHYKRGGTYEVVTLAVKEDTLEPLVVYRSLDHNSIWVRTYANFIESVELNGKKIQRFLPL